MARWDAIIGLISGVFGGGVTALFSWLTSRSTNEISKHEIIYNGTDSLASELRKASIDLNKVQIENAELKGELIMLRSEIGRLTKLVAELQAERKGGTK